MNKNEQLKEEAREYAAKKLGYDSMPDYTSDEFDWIVDAYIDGYKKGEKREKEKIKM